MSNFILRNSIYVLIGISSIVWFSLAWISNLDLSAAKDFFGLVPKVVTIDLLLIALFVKWGWKLSFLRGWLVLFPNLNGTWLGHIYSDWVNPETGEKVPPIPVMLTINQSFSHISCVMHTGEMKSFSYSEGFNIDQDKQIKQIAYVYTSKPRISLKERNLPHDGAITFNIIEQPSYKLKGRYWTERKTTGEIELSFHSKEILEEIPDSVGTHPVTEAENVR